MKVMEAHRARHVVLRLDRGEELPAALTRALEEAGVKSAWIEGVGTLEAAEMAVYDARLRTYSKARSFEPGGDVVSLKGNVSQLEGNACVRLFATLARETDAGLQVVAGELLWSRVFSLEIHLTAFEDAGLARVADERSGLLALVRAASAPSAEAKHPQGPPTQDAPPAAHAPLPPAKGTARADATLPSIVEMARAAVGGGEAPQHLAPPRREKPVDDPSETFPEVGDMATHFHFGECKIISSDGDKIRLQQLKDLRVREVALGALRTELVSEDPTTHQRHYKLLRKN